MTEPLAFDLAAQLVTRVVATGLIVVGIALAVERLGPRVGGALAGLPIVIGPGFFFLMREHGSAFVAEAATTSLLSLCASEAFLLAYCVTARWHRPALALGAATLAWLLAALLLSWVPPVPLLALTLFALSAAASRRIGRRFVRPTKESKVPGSHLLLLVRGLAAGLLVAAATLAASRLGAGWSGFLLTYPIGLSVVSITVHQRSGADAAIATLHAVMLGVASLAAFSLIMAVTIGPFGPTAAFAAALAASVAVTSLLTWRSAQTRGH